MYVFAVVALATAAVHANLVDSPKDAKKRTGECKTRRMQAAFADHLRHVGRVYPAGRHRRVVLPIDDAPWHARGPARAVLADHPHLELKRLPGYSPQLNPVEQFWKQPRWRATHNRLFDTPGDLRRSLRASVGYYRTMRSRVRTLIDGKPKKPTASAGS